jgi:hypothetical protein
MTSNFVQGYLECIARTIQLLHLHEDETDLIHYLIQILNPYLIQILNPYLDHTIPTIPYGYSMVKAWMGIRS